MANRTVGVEMLGVIGNIMNEEIFNKKIFNDEIDHLVDMSGLTRDECINLMDVNNWSVEETKDNLEFIVTGTATTAYTQEAIIAGIENAGLYSKMAENLSNLNTMRGGEKGFKGFVFEEMHATNATVNGQTTLVINNNGIADFKIIAADGKVTYAQAKLGYGNGNIDFSAYEGQTIVIDKGNTALIEKAKAANMKVVESDISAEEASRLAKNMQTETKITGSKNSHIVPKVDSAINIAKEAHNVGIKAAKTGAQVGGGFSLGSNVVEVISGDKSIEDAAGDVVIDTAISAGIGYATGVATTAIGSTAAGVAVTTAATTATTAATAAIGSTALGASALAAGTTAATTGAAVVGAVGGVGTAAVTTTLAAGSAIGAAATAGTAAIGTAVTSTAVGGAIAAGSAAAGTAIAGTAVGGAAIAAGAAATGAAVAAGTAVAAAAVVAAPVVAVAATAGALFTIGKKLIGRR